jgi:hypothetical protein
MSDDVASEDYDLLQSCSGVSVAHCSRPDGCGGYTGPGHLSVQTSGYTEVDLDQFLPLLHRVRCTFDLEFLGPVSDEYLRHLPGLTKILSLKVCYGAITDAGLRHVAGLTSLRVFDLARQAVTDTGAAHIAGLTGLLELNLRDTKVGDAGLAALRGLTALTKLDLAGCPVTDRGVEALVGLAGLKSLDLSGTSVGDEGLATVGQLASLESLSLDTLAVTDRGAAALAALANLQSLSLHGTRVGSDGAAWLAGLPRLGWLTLSDTAVTDDALGHLAGCEGLINLRLDNARVSGRGLAQLPERLWHLSLSGVRLRDDDLAALGRLESLHSLVLDADAVTDTVLEVLERMNLAQRPAWSEDVAAFERLRTCPICRRPIRDGQAVFCTRPYTPTEPDLFAYARVPIHWDCYATWEHRPRFARLYFEEQVGWSEANQFWATARKDDVVLVSVNPSRYVGEADVILAATGSSLRVPLADWEEWVAGGWFDACAHEAERDALGEVIPSLRAELPTAEALLTAAGVAAEDAAPVSSGVEPGGMVDRISYEFACEKLAARAAEKGMACPQCGHFGTEFRYERVERVTADGQQSRLVCPECDAGFGPDDV